MNVLVDGRAFVRTSAGIATVLRCVLTTWGEQYPEDKLYVILPKKMHKSMDGYHFPESVVWIEPKSIIYKYLPNIIFLFLMVPIMIKRYKINVYYSPVPTLPYFIPRKVKTIIEVNDVVNLEFAETMYLKNKVANALFFNRAIKKADIIWSISEYTKERINYYFPKRRCSDIFVGCAVDKRLFKRLELSNIKIKQIKDKYGIMDRFVLFVGSLEPRKNLTFLLQIIPEIYSKTGIQLVVVGARGWKDSDIFEIVNNNLFLKESTIFCGYVSNDELVELYNIANCFVSASLNEGFGLPQLEAFMCGCPVVTAANSAMIEVTQNKRGGLLIEGYDKSEWVKGIIAMVEEKPKVIDVEFLEYDWDVIVNKIVDKINNK